MAKAKKANDSNNASAQMGGYPFFGQGMASSMPASSAKGKGKKSKKKSAKQKALKAQRKEQARVMRNRQKYAMQNNLYRRRVEAVEGSGGVDNRYYRLPIDKKEKNGKDYFFVMRKFVCFLMFVILLVSVAYFAIGFVGLDAVPEQFTALFVETDAVKKDDADDSADDGDKTDDENADGEVAANADISSLPLADGSEADATEDDADDEGEEEEESGKDKSSFDGVAYGALDPIFGFLKYIGNKLNVDLNFGDSPLYDQMVTKVEVGMNDTVATYIILAFPVAMIIYIIIAVVMMIKAFIGMFGGRIFKRFGLGSILMIVCAVVTALGGLAFTTEITGSMNYGNVVGILTGLLTGAGGFSGGYGLLILIVLPVLVLILSMFCRKKIPYSIFDTFGE